MHSLTISLSLFRQSPRVLLCVRSFFSSSIVLYMTLNLMGAKKKVHTYIPIHSNPLDKRLSKFAHIRYITLNACADCHKLKHTHIHSLIYSILANIYWTGQNASGFHRCCVSVCRHISAKCFGGLVLTQQDVANQLNCMTLTFLLLFGSMFCNLSTATVEIEYDKQQAVCYIYGLFSVLWFIGFFFSLSFLVCACVCVYFMCLTSSLNLFSHSNFSYTWNVLWCCVPSVYMDTFCQCKIRMVICLCQHTRG